MEIHHGLRPHSKQLALQSAVATLQQLALQSAVSTLQSVVNGMPDEVIDTHVQNILDKCEETIQKIESIIV